MIELLRNLVVRDFWLKLFSLGLAGLLWFTVNMMSNKNPVSSLALGPLQVKTFYSLPVTIMSSAADVHSFRVQPKEINVTVQGDRKIIDSLQAHDIRAIVDLSGIEAAPFLLKRVEVSTPAGVTHVGVNPQQVQIVSPPKE